MGTITRRKWEMLLVFHNIIGLIESNFNVFPHSAFFLRIWHVVFGFNILLFVHGYTQQYLFQYHNMKVNVEKKRVIMK